MQKWEYLKIDLWEDEFSHEVREITSNGTLVYKASKKDVKLLWNDYLADIGKQGWEMVTAHQRPGRVVMIFYFKRPID